MNAYLNVMHTTTCNCAACAPVPTLGIKMPYEEEKKELVKTRKGRQKLVVGENDLATVAPKVAAMLSEKDKHFAFEVTAGSKRKLVFVCPNCGQEFEATIQNVVRSVNHNLTGCPVCAGKKIVPGVNDLASKYPEIAAMWSGKNKLSASEVAVKSNKKVFFKCRDCGKEFETKIEHVVYAVETEPLVALFATGARLFPVSTTLLRDTQKLPPCGVTKTKNLPWKLLPRPIKRQSSSVLIAARNSKPKSEVLSIL